MKVDKLSDEELLQLLYSEDERKDTSDLEIYNSFDEKRNIFGTYARFDSSTKFMDFINYKLPDLLGTNSAVYRGLASAQYRLFNKAQRFYRAKTSNDNKDEERYHTGITEMIANARSVNNRALPAFFQATGLKDSHISALSFLQHYGAPTPFMDWTTDPFVRFFLL
jgi:hypothetical protein